MGAASGDLALLAVRIETELASLRRDMQRAEATVKSAGRDIDRSLDKVQRSSKAAAASFGLLRRGAALALGAVSVGGIASLVKNSLELADSIDKASIRLGVNAEALQLLRFGASQSGVEIGQLDAALGRFSKSLGELKTRTDSEVVTALKNFDRELLESLKATSDVEKGVLLAADAIAGYSDPTERAAVVTALFGRSGLQLLPFLENGSRGIDTLSDRARRFGVVLNDEARVELVKAKDDIEAFTQAVKVRATRAIGDAIPVFREFFGIFSEGAQGGLERIDTAIEKIEKRLRVARENIANDPFVGLFGTSPGARANEQAAQRLQEQLDQLVATREIIAREIAQDPASPVGPGGKVGPSEKEAKKQAELEESFLRQKESLEAELARGEIERAERVAQAQIRAIEAEFGQTERTVELKRLVQDKLEKDIIASETRAFEAKQELREKEIELAERAAKEIADAQKRVLESSASVVADLVLDGEDALGRLAESFKRDFIETIIQEAIKASGVIDLLFAERKPGAPTPGLGEVAGSALVKGIGALGSLFGGARAGGGPVSPNRAFLVGERGPELFVPQVSGTVMANASGGGTTLVQPLIRIVTNGRVQADEIQVRQMGSGAQRFTEIQLAAVGRSIRGGPLRRDLQETFNLRPRVER